MSLHAKNLNGTASGVTQLWEHQNIKKWLFLTEKAKDI